MLTIVTEELKTLKDWFAVNGLSMNVSKTQMIEFSAFNLDKNFNINSSTISINSRNSVDYLGIKIDSHLNWKEQIESMSKRLSSATFVLRVVRDTTNLETQITIYHAYFSSIMNYGIIVWGSTNLAKKILALQKRVLRLIAKVPLTTSCRPLFINFKILTLYSSYIFQISLMVKENFDTFMQNQHNHIYQTRSKNSLKPVQHRTKIFHLSPQYMGPKIYNKLPDYIKDLAQFNQFKRHLKEWLLERAFYSIEEFLEGE